MKTLIQSLLRPLGLRLTRLSANGGPNYGSSVLFSTLRNFGFSPHLVLDIGANHGNWTRAALSYLPNAEYVLIEPQDHLKVHIQDLLDGSKKIRWVANGISDANQAGCPFMWQTAMTAAPFSHEKNGQTRITSETIVEAQRLDDFLSANNLPVPDMVKIDAEGLDLKVMQGAASIVGKTEIFLLEAAAICPFENSVGCVISTMENLGYRLLDITELNRSPKHSVLWLTELAFLRNNSPLLASVVSYE